jgi:hypothetical protein
MSAMLTNDAIPGGPWVAVARFLAQYPAANRAEALHLALQSLRDRVEPDRVLACELAWEMHTHGYWSQIRRPDGGPYESEEAYFRDVLGLASWRTAYKRLAIGRMLMGFEEPERSQLRAAIGVVGLAKATIVVPAIERLREWKPWLEWAGQLPTIALQEKVSAALEALPRGREPSPPGERFRRMVLAAMPDIEAIELVDRFFEIGAEVVGTPHPIGIFLAGCRECLGEWEVLASQWSRPGASRISDAIVSERAVCLRGQNPPSGTHEQALDSADYAEWQSTGANGEPGA